MSVIPHGPIEYAMTHRPGVGGQAERCFRPASVLEMAQRVRTWRTQPETCKSCQSLPAVSVRDGLPLCSRCRENRGLRFHVPDVSGLKPAIRAEDDPSGPQLRGYSVVFNERSVDLGGFTEIIRPAAADRMEAEKPDMRALWNHDTSVPLGRVSAGTHRARKATKGVAVEIDPPRWAANHVESVERRDVTGMSFGFITITDDWHMEDEEIVREVLDMHILESSPVSFPAYPQTSIKAIGAGSRSVERMSLERLRMAR